MYKMFFLLKKMSRDLVNGRSASTAANYENAVRALNNLQSNATYIQAATRHDSSSNTNLEETRKYLIRSGVSLDQLDTLSVIHVAGTKGKGSTCAFTEAILRGHGFSTGFYSSPHLVNVRERFRINGQPISEHEFARHFWKVYNSLDKRKAHDLDMPPYFKFLTVLMFHIFLESNIDVAILEVGIGGEHDCTNVIRHPVCTGITSLGLDHTALLGNTLESIAYQKSGIFKENTYAFTVPQQKGALNILKKRAAEIKCKLSIVPDFHCYPWSCGAPLLRNGSKVQENNASLALQLACTWMAQKIGRKSTLNASHYSNLNNNDDNQVCNSAKICPMNKYDNNVDENHHNSIQNLTEKDSVKQLTGLAFDNENGPSNISLEKTVIALSSCTWPGRFQVMRGRKLDFYIDGAHTVDSIEVCASWFENRVRNIKGKRFLIFNTTGDRDSVKLLAPLRRLKFKNVYFVPNVAGTIPKADQQNFSVTTAEQTNRCLRHCSIWGDGSVFLNSVSEALSHISDKNDIERPQLLITGSLHLVGAALACLDPDLTMATHY